MKNLRVAGQRIGAAGDARRSAPDLFADDTELAVRAPSEDQDMVHRARTHLIEGDRRSRGVERTSGPALERRTCRLQRRVTPSGVFCAPLAPSHPLLDAALGPANAFEPANVVEGLECRGVARGARLLPFCEHLPDLDAGSIRSDG